MCPGAFADLPRDPPPPDREVLKERLEALRQAILDAQAIVSVAGAALERRESALPPALHQAEQALDESPRSSSDTACCARARLPIIDIIAFGPSGCTLCELWFTWCKPWFTLARCLKSSSPRRSTSGSRISGIVRHGRIQACITRLAHGNPGDVKPVGHGVREMRIDCGPGYRVYYLQDGPVVVVLLCGGDKRTQTADIRRAHEIARDWRG